MGTRGRIRSERAALAALAVTLALIAVKLLLFMATGSLAVLSQAVDSGLDVVALTLLWLGVRIAGKPADAEHHYGHAKAENLAAFTQTIVLGMVVAGIVVESVQRLVAGGVGPRAPGWALAVLAGTAAVDAARVHLLLHTARKEGSEALRAGALNFATDLGTALVTLVSLVAVRLGVPGADAVGALVVAAAVAGAAWRLGRRSVDVLMDRAPDDRLQAIYGAAASAPGVEEARRVRLRSSGHQLFADVTVTAGRTASLERAHDIAEAVEREIERVAPGTDVVVHVEPAAAVGLVERAQGAASRVPGVSEVHNVLVHSFGGDKLHVTLHAKVAPDTSLAAAHELSERIEQEVRAELSEATGRAVRVDTHIEPRRTTESGREVTSEHPDLVAEVRATALAEPDVLDCHEVVVNASGQGALTVVAHVRGRASLPLERIHDASERIEKEVRSRHPEVSSVLLHFEPA